ncbi:MAG: ATP-binding cassette domain-containing protein [Eubacteriaceae bacterium]|nr:ATP-binding cassette domain-containing protein [Eubacteriaceae bacterium]
MAETVLKVENLKTHFDVTKGLFAKKQIVKAVDDVSFEVNQNETFGLVGESGCGKTTLGRTIVRIYDPVGGHIYYRGQDISSLKGDDLKAYHKKVQMIFQDPYASLNPRMTVGEIVREPMNIHNLHDPKERDDIVADLLKIVGLNPDHIRRYPSEFSGGQRQRIGIARSLSLDPEFIVCDEPISALDVSIQAQVINLLEKIQKERDLSYLFIAHDLSMVKHISQRIGVMYLGHLVEVGDSNEVYHDPLHPYSKALLSSVPIPDPRISRTKQRIVMSGEIPSPINPPPVCPFLSRCPYATARCSEAKPEPVKIGTRQVSCFLYEK